MLPANREAKLKYKDVAKIMGRRVLVEGVYHRDSCSESGHKRSHSWHASKRNPRSGWVTGVTWLLSGEVVHYWDEPNEFKETGARLQCLRVVFWPNRKEVKVPLDMCKLQEEHEEPLPHDDSYKWSDRDREMAREEAKLFKRDEKGRFLSEFVETNKKAAHG